MKRKRFDRDIWNFGNSPYYQMRIDTDDFHGLVCLLKLMNGNLKIEAEIISIGIDQKPEQSRFAAKE